jgi:hypothetical protein
MTTEAFVEFRAKQLRKFFHVLWGRKWRYTLARRMGRLDAPRFLVARPGKHRVTLAQLVPVERFAMTIGFDSDYWDKNYYGFAPEESRPPAPTGDSCAEPAQEATNRDEEVQRRVENLFIESFGLL